MPAINFQLSAPCPRCPNPEELEPGTVTQDGTRWPAYEYHPPEELWGEWSECDMCGAKDWTTAEKDTLYATAEE